MVSFETFNQLFDKALKVDDVEAFVRKTILMVEEPEEAWLLRSVWSIARDQSMKNLAGICGMAVRRVAITLGMPTRTMEGWSGGFRKPSPWLFRMVVYAALSNAYEENVKQ